jgi:hypothetical protein
MGFDDMLDYEGNCVKEALALPELEITITVYDTYSDCETCGAYWSRVLEVDGDLGEFQSGDRASCLGSNDDGTYHEVAQWINARLEEHGRPVPVLLTPDAMLQADNEYYAQAALVNHDYNHPSLEALGHKAGCLSDAFDAYYTLDNLKRLYSAFGVTIYDDHKADEVYDASDWGDYEDNEEEECQDD